MNTFKLIKTIAPLTCCIMLCSCGSTNNSDVNNNNNTSSQTLKDTSAPKMKINLKDYALMGFKGYDTIGDPSNYGIDTEKMVQDNSEAFGGSTPAIISDVSEYFDISIDKHLLSNGDVIHMLVGDRYKELSDKYNVDINADGLEFTVSGLTELQEIDPFDSAEVTFTDPLDGTQSRICSFNIMGCYKWVDCNIDKGVANIGDTVKITFTSALEGRTVEQAFAEDGFKPTQTEKEYIVE